MADELMVGLSRVDGYENDEESDKEYSLLSVQSSDIQ